MTKPFDVSKFRKSITKSVPGMSVGFRDPDTWISTGNFCLNKLISGSFTKGIPLGKVSVFAGESGAGKSYICSGNIIKDAQEQGIFVILIDSENACDEKWLHALGVDTSDDKLLKLNMAMIDDVAKVIHEFVENYRKEYSDFTVEERPKVLFVVDSLGMLMSPTETAQFEKGDLKGDMGRKAKALKALVTNCVNMFGDLNIGLVATNHTYASQDMFNPDPVVSGGSGFVYASSIVVALQKRKLKEDLDGNKTSQVNGIRAACKVVKSRYAKPFETVEVKIPYDTGMDPYSGLLEFFEKAGVIVRDGNRLRYTCKDGSEIKEFRKNWTNEQLDLVMMEWEDRDITDGYDNITDTDNDFEEQE